MPHLDRLLDPKSIAIVGLSEDASKHGGRVLSSLRKARYGGQVWGVHPRTPAVPGVEMFESLLALPRAPDLVASAVPAGAVPGIVADAAAVGAGVVVVFAGGFAEAGADGLGAQRHLTSIATEGGVRVLGPNSGGVIRPDANLAVSFLTCLDRPAEEIRSGPVGLVTQSGGTGSYIHNLAAERGSGLGASISVGNEADIDIADGIVALAEMEEIRAIAVVMETVRNGRTFLDAMSAASAAGKPVVVCRLGTSEHGRAMTTTHTGAMAQPAVVLDGVLASLGVTMAETPGELLDIAEVMARAAPPPGRRVGVVTHSGGVAILLSDLAERHGLDLPQPSSELSADLGELLEHGVAGNPLDMGGIIGGAARFAAVVDRFAASSEFDAVLAVSTAHPRAHTAERARTLVASAHPTIHLWMAGDVGAEGLDALRQAGLPVTTEPRAAIRALAGLTSAAHDPRPVSLGAGASETRPGSPLDERASKKVVSDWGVAVPRGGIATSAGQAQEVARRLGEPVVVKVRSADISHKTDVGGIATDVSAEHADRAFTEVTTRASENRPNAVITGVLVEEQIRGFEVIVGAAIDPVFGAMMLVGMGGIAAEGFEPVMGLVPRTSTEAVRLLERAPGLSVALHRIHGIAASRLSEVITSLGNGFLSSGLIEFEINPLVWSGNEWVALDALAVPAAPTSTPAPM